jgi:AraC-like DNA-binding protein/quercetin dioxygenase-like cupin family protein
MTIKQILSEITGGGNSLPPERYPKYQDVVSKAGKYEYFTLYPDKSRSIDDIISVIGMITAKDSPLVSIIGSVLLHRRAEARQYYFDNGLGTSLHTHNYAELGYVMEGQFHTKIAGRNYVFNKGGVFLINRGVPHNEYLFRENTAVLFLSIVNTFFDKSMHHDAHDRETENFLRRFLIGGNTKYQFIRFIQNESVLHNDKLPQTPKLFEQILTELWRPHPGSTHLIIGYVEWILSLLSTEYKAEVQWNDRDAAGNALFEEIRRYLENQYLNAAVDDLIEHFGHNRYYFNRLIKKHTDLTYSGFLQNIKLAKAEFLLRTTGFTVEEIAHQTGYENLTYFYRIFQKKFSMTPDLLRKSASPQMSH